MNREGVTDVWFGMDEHRTTVPHRTLPSRDAG